MNKNTLFPLVVVTCTRDLAMLDLQAQSLKLYLEPGTTIYIVVNEADPRYWQQYFDQNIRHYYDNHNLIVIYKSKFHATWAHRKNLISAGWEDQQILKLIISEVIDDPYYLVLDTQNFLLRPLLQQNFAEIDGKIPYRSGLYVMPVSIWHDYCHSLGVSVPDPTTETMSICTPLFMHTALVKDLISTYGGSEEFSIWFHNASKIKSEFILYYIWAEKQGGFDKFHYRTNDWISSHLRDTPELSNAVKHFINCTGRLDFQIWSMVNHRAWGDISDVQYSRICKKLNKYQLHPNFVEYRQQYVDIKI